MWRKNLEKLREIGRYDGPDDPKLSYLEALVNSGQLRWEDVFDHSPSDETNGYPEVKLIVLDVDGVLTDGGLYYGKQGEELKRFDVKDGHAINQSIKKGLQIAIISRGSTPEIVESRARKLGITESSVDKTPKADRLRALLERTGVDATNCAFIGDDHNDLEAMKLCGISACPADAAELVKDSVDIVLRTNGGHGCVREFIERFTRFLSEV